MGVVREVRVFPLIGADDRCLLIRPVGSDADDVDDMFKSAKNSIGHCG